MGAGTFGLFKRFHSAMNAHNWAWAADELDHSRWQDQVDRVLGDKKGRADDLITQLITGNYV